MNDHFMIAVIAVVGIVALVGVISISGGNQGAEVPINWPEDNVAGEGRYGGDPEEGVCFENCKYKKGMGGNQVDQCNDFCGNSNRCGDNCFGACDSELREVNSNAGDRETRCNWLCGRNIECGGGRGEFERV